MSSHRDQMLAALRLSGPMCDDCLAQATMIHPRQTVNMLARDLVKKRLLQREVMLCPACRREKIVSDSIEGSSALGGHVAATRAQPAQSKSDLRKGRPWYWEGHVQDAIVKHLAEKGYRVESVADTVARATGKDIVAVAPDGRPLWVSVKGYPEKSVHVQARHWFAGAFLDMARYREESDDAALAIGLPDGFVTYRRLLTSVAKGRRLLDFGIYWVSADGSVSHERHGIPRA